MSKETPKNQNPVQRTIFTKERLIIKLRKEITNIRSEADYEIEKINFRIKMAQTLVDALKKGQQP